MSGFETFTRRMVPLTKRPYITIQKRGTMSLNKAAFAALGSPDAIELLYDRIEQIVGLRAVDPTVEHAYAPRGIGSKDDPTTYMVSTTAFTQFYNIDTTLSRRWPADMQDGVLCIDLKREGTIVTSNRSIPAGETTPPQD